MRLACPFPYYGGKSRWAPVIWDRIGDPGVYVEPFAGSIVVLLNRPAGAGPREVVADTDGGLCNFWRATIADPEEVAYWADYPTIHQDLTARHTWLRQWIRGNAARLSQDPEFCDAKMAGWWVWGMSLWIGGGWCNLEYRDVNSRPIIERSNGGHGISAQSGMRYVKNLDRRPMTQPTSGGRGISAQNMDGQRTVSDKKPQTRSSRGSNTGIGVSAQRGQIPRCKVGGEGVSAQRRRLFSDSIPGAASIQGGRGISAQKARRQNLVEWFERLQERLFAVVVLNRSWESAVTPTVLQQTPSGPKPDVGILMDPPYRLTTGRQAELYESDSTGESEDIAVRAFAWARQHGEAYRIAYCAHEGDFALPDGWTSVSRDFAGIRKASRRMQTKEIIMFSPACLDAADTGLQGSFWNDNNVLD